MTERRQPDVGTQLVKLRQERGLSLRALAKECGLSANAINRIERGESSPTVSSLHQLATALDVALTEFFRVEPEHSVILVRENRRPRSRGDGVLMESLGTGLYGQHLGPFHMTLMPGASAGEESDSSWGRGVRLLPGGSGRLPGRREVVPSESGRQPPLYRLPEAHVQQYRIGEGKAPAGHPSPRGGDRIDPATPSHDRGWTKHRPYP